MKKIVFLLLVSFCAFSQTGIGTTTPVNKLDIFAPKADPASSGLTSNGNLRLGATGSNNHVLDFGLSSTSTYGWLQARDKSNYATPYILSLNPNGGWVGIGTSAPAATLDVNGNVTNSAYNGTLSGFSANLNSPPSATTSYTLLSSDNGKILNFTGSSATTVTVPISLPAGFNCMVIQNGSGQISISPASTVNINNRNNFTKTAGQYAIVTIVHLGSNTFITSGEMSN